MKRLIVLVLVLLLLAGLIGGFGYFQFVVKPEMIKGFIMKSPRPAATVATELARTETWMPTLPAIGTIRAVQGVDVTPVVGGVVRTINFDSGQTVAKGAVLVQLDDSIEQADLKSGLALLKNAQLDLERQQELLQRGSAAKTNYDLALAKRDTAAATVDRTKAVIAQKSITAAFGGRLGIRNVDLGQYVSPGTMLVTLQQLSTVFVDFPVPEQDLTSLRVGQSIEVVVDAEPGRKFDGKVDSIDARVSQATRNVLVRARVDSPDAHLLPGMFANVNVLAGEPRQVVTLPRTAVSYSLYGDSIYVVNAKPAGAAAVAEKPAAPQLTVERRFVQVGEARGDRVAIKDGVAAGEQVVVAGQIKLQPGAAVSVDNSAPLTAPAVRHRE